MGHTQMTLMHPKPNPRQREPKPLKRSTPMRRVSRKKAAHRASEEGKAGLAYMGLVRTLPCCVSGLPGPSEAHHCRDLPPLEMQGVYNRLPCFGRKSGDFDVIPLSPLWHRLGPDAYHVSPERWQHLHGFDWEYIEATRKAVAELEGDLLDAWF